MKTRHLSMLDFFEQLQKEYIIIELRSRIYTNEIDREYFKNSMSYKKPKIEDISTRNNIDSIFTSIDEYKRVYSLIVDFGIPKFEYRNLHQETKLKEKDIKNYFSENSDFKIKQENKIVFGTTIECDFEKQICVCKIKGEKDSKVISFKNMMRIV